MTVKSNQLEEENKEADYSNMKEETLSENEGDQEIKEENEEQRSMGSS